jgi:sulfur carrier protein ThiS
MALVRVEVKLSDKAESIEAEEGVSVESLLQKLGPQWRNNVVVIVNGRVAKAEDLLHASDRIVIFPLLAGG